MLKKKDVSYLVDPASNHMLDSKIKPCMSKYKQLYSETANGSLYQYQFTWRDPIIWITVVILELIHEKTVERIYSGSLHLLD